MKKAIYFLPLLFVTACSSYYANSDARNYLKSCNGPNLVIPAPLSSFNVSHFYDLPPQTEPADVSIVPPS